MPADDSRRVSTALGALFGLAAMGSASAAVALPDIAHHFDLGIGAATWTISLYALLLAVTTAVYGRVSDLMGVRAPLLAGVALMALGALLAALAPSYAVLLVGRALQGAGAAAVPTLGVAILSSRYEGGVRDLALGRLAGASAVLASAGPLLGGLAEAALGWRAVLVLPAFGVLVVPLIWHTLVGSGSGARLDVRGAVLVAAAASGLVLLLQSPATGLVVAGVGVLLLALGVPMVRAHVRRRPDGFLPAAVIGNGVVVRSAVAAAAVPAAWFGMLIAVPAVLVADGWSPWQVGLLMLPSAGVALVIPRVTGPLLSAIGGPRAITLSAVTASGALAVSALGAALTNPWIMGVAVLGVTFAFLLGQPAMSAAVGGAVAPTDRGVALGVATLVFLTGGSIGSAVVGGVGAALTIAASLGLLALLPVLGVVVLRPLVRAGRTPAPEPAGATGPV